MPHQRTLIRKAVVAMLESEGVKIAAGTPREQVVPWFENRVEAVFRDEYPLGIVYTFDERNDTDHTRQTAPRETRRTLELVVEVGQRYVKETDLDDQLDDVALQVERALHRDDTLQCTAADCVYSRTEFSILPVGNTVIGTIRIFFDVEYYEDAPKAEDVTLGPFDGADVQHNLGGQQDEADRAKDKIDLEQ